MRKYKAFLPQHPSLHACKAPKYKASQIKSWCFSCHNFSSARTTTTKMKFTNVNLLLSATAVVTTAPLIISAQVSSRHPIRFVCYSDTWKTRLFQASSSHITLLHFISLTFNLEWQAPCPAPWVLNSVYDEGDQVTSFDNLNVTNNIYECNAWPFNHLCGQSGFQPGSNDIGPGKPQNDPEPAWKMAWTLVGGCSRTPVSMINRSSNVSMFVTMIITSNQNLISPLHPFNFD